MAPSSSIGIPHDPPFIVLITALGVVPEAEVVARLHRARALPPAARARLVVQVRDPELSGGELLGLAGRLRTVTRHAGALLVVNDRLDVALAVGADGVHLGRRSVAITDARALLGAESFVSAACHSIEECVAAASAGADAVLLSPIFASPGKGAPLGVPALSEARRALDAAGTRALLVALGGVDATNARACLFAGASGVAAIRADLVMLANAPAHA